MLCCLSGGRKNRSIVNFLDTVQWPMKFRYYLKFHGAWMAFCRVIEGKISALQVEYPAPKNLVITIEFTTNTTGYSLSTASCKEHAFQVLSNLAKRYWRWSCLNEKVNVHTHGRTMDKTVSQTLTLSLCDTWAKKQQHENPCLPLSHVSDHTSLSLRLGGAFRPGHDPLCRSWPRLPFEPWHAIAPV